VSALTPSPLPLRGRGATDRLGDDQSPLARAAGEGPGERARSRISIAGAERFRSIPSRTTLARWIRSTLERSARITLVLADVRTARRLNRTYRQRDYATNVLTFCYQDAPVVVADVVVCVAVARAEAARQGKTLRAHLAHLVIHGVLHAQGYDHVRVADARRMQALEAEHLARLRIANPYE
jgi:probable rRNA maturation factor